MKIGIITFHLAHNYGAVLQAYALQEHLKNKGLNIVIIDYQAKHLIKSYYNSSWLSMQGMSVLRKLKRIMGNIYRLLLFKFRIKRVKAFKNFIDSKLLLCKNYQEINFDYCVLGSDQIWNKNITNNDYFYFEYLQNNTKLISYAASAGAAEELIFNDDRALSAIHKLYAIGVREETLKTSLEKHISQKINLVIDPTLLVDPCVFNQIAVKPAFKDKYCLIYKILDNNSIDKMTNKLSQKAEVKTLKLKASVDLKGILNIKREKMFETPEQFLGWFKYAEFIVTTSFHGVAFAIIFNKPFYFVSSGHKAENRITSLLSQLGLQDRIVAENTDLEFNIIDYNKPQEDGSSVNEKLNRLREDSDAFLSSALK